MWILIIVDCYIKVLDMMSSSYQGAFEDPGAVYLLVGIVALAIALSFILTARIY
jgi:hypothetical protein